MKSTFFSSVTAVEDQLYLKKQNKKKDIGLQKHILYINKISMVMSDGYDMMFKTQRSYS